MSFSPPPMMPPPGLSSISPPPGFPPQQFVAVPAPAFGVVPNPPSIGGFVPQPQYGGPPSGFPMISSSQSVLSLNKDGGRKTSSVPPQQPGVKVDSKFGPSVDTVVNKAGQVAKLTTIGPMLDEKLQMTDRQTGEMLAGIGIFFQQESNSFIYVASITQNGSADRCGVIRPHDELIQIDGLKIEPNERLEDVRQLVLGRPGGQYGTQSRNEYYHYDVELMRGSVEYLQARQKEMMARPDYSQYELEIARLRDEIDALRHQQEIVQDDPRVAPLEEELKARMEDLRRFEQMLMRSQERTKDAERSRKEAVDSLRRLKEENDKLQAREKDHVRTMEDMRSKNSAQAASLEQIKRQMLQELEAEKKLKANVEKELKDVEQEIAKLKESNAPKGGRYGEARSRLRQGHSTIREALQAQEQQLAILADVIPALDMVQSALISSIALDPIRLQSYELSLPKTPRLKDPLAQPPPLSASIHSLRGVLNYDGIRVDSSKFQPAPQQYMSRPKVLEDVA